MRSVKFAKVKGHDSLVRDMTSHAIISTNDSDYNAYLKRRDLEKKNKKLMDDQAEQISELRSDMQEIKQMLVQIIKGQ